MTLFRRKAMLSFRVSFLALLSLLVVLLGGCHREPVVKNYESANCPGGEEVRLSRNVPSLATSYILFNIARTKPDFAQVKLEGNYALGSTKLHSQTFPPEVTIRLNGSANSNQPNTTDSTPFFMMKVFSLVELPESVKESQILKFSEPCQVETALLADEFLRIEPSTVLYLIAGKSSFILMQDKDENYKPNPIMPVKFKLLNPKTSKVEEATFRLHSITGGDFLTRPVSLLESPFKYALNLVKKEETTSGWSIKKHTKLINGQTYDYFTVVKDNFGEEFVGEIQSIEFLPLEIEQ
jgi:hypothetical protein